MRTRAWSLALLFPYVCVFTEEKQVYLVRSVQDQLAYDAYLRGLELHRQGRAHAAIEEYTRAVQLRDDFPQAHNNLGLLIQDPMASIKHFHMAMHWFEFAEDKSRMLNNLGNVYLSLAQREQAFENLNQAISIFLQALELFPENIDACFNLGKALATQGRIGQARNCFMKALTINPRFGRAAINIGNLEYEHGNYSGAVWWYAHSATLECDTSDYAVIYTNLGQIQRVNNNFTDATAMFVKASLYDNNLHTRANIILSKLFVADWRDMETDVHAFISAMIAHDDPVQDGGPRCPIDPYHLLLLPLHNTSVDKIISQRWCNAYQPMFTEYHSLQELRARPLRVGYLSYDYRTHPMGRLTKGVLTRSYPKHEVIALSYGPDDNSSVRMEIKNGVRVFVDYVYVNTDAEIATHIKEEIAPDIIVDLMGHTTKARIALSQLRPAPIIVQWLGFPGTMGCSSVTHAIIDRTCVPVELSWGFTEKLVYLPTVYQGNDYPVDVCMCGKLSLPLCRAALRYSRKGMNTSTWLKFVSETTYIHTHIHKLSTQQISGLIGVATPPTPFTNLFCSFHGVHKFEPTIFAVWMGILARTPNSAHAYISLRNDSSIDYIHNYAGMHGIHPSRIFPISSTDWESHITRLGGCDLFLDTLVYGAHTTASDALWGGIPILTVNGWGEGVGGKMPGKVATSILTHLGVDLTTVYSLREYEDVAAMLAQKSAVMHSVRQTIRKQLLRSAVFSTDVMVSALDEAYRCLVQIHTHAHTQHLGLSQRMHLVVTPTHTDIHKSEAPALWKSRLLDFVGQLRDDADTHTHIHTSGHRAMCALDRGLQSFPGDEDIIHAMEQLVKELHPQKEFSLDEFGLKFEKITRTHTYETCPKAALTREFFSCVLNVHEGLIHGGFLQLASEIVTTLVQAFTPEPTPTHQHTHTHTHIPIDDLETRRLFDTVEPVANLIATLLMGNAIAMFRNNHTYQSHEAILRDVSYAASLAPEDITIVSNTYAILQALQGPQHAHTYMETALPTQASLVAKDLNTQQKFIYWPKLNAPNASRISVVAFYCFEYFNSWWPNWGPHDLDKGGLGGSEEAVVYMSRKLRELGYEVEIYNEAPVSDLGTDSWGVQWFHYQQWDPELQRPMYACVFWRYGISSYLGQRCGKRYVWLHDLVSANEIPQTLVNKLDGIFLQSQFHMSKMPEYVHPKCIIVPNGLNEKHFYDGPNPHNVFVFASSPLRGLQQVLEAWPSIYDNVPGATLKIFYGFTPSTEANMQKMMGEGQYPRWRDWILTRLTMPGIDYRGMVNHSTLAYELARSGFLLYPTTFPETGCITAMKAMAMGCIPVTSLYPNSTLPDLTPPYDLGLQTHIHTHTLTPQWMEAWTLRVIQASQLDKLGALDIHRRDMKASSRMKHSWHTSAQILHAIFSQS